MWSFRNGVGRTPAQQGEGPAHAAEEVTRHGSAAAASANICEHTHTHTRTHTHSRDHSGHRTAHSNRRTATGARTRQPDRDDRIIRDVRLLHSTDGCRRRRWPAAREPRTKRIQPAERMIRTRDTPLHSIRSSGRTDESERRAQTATSDSVHLAAGLALRSQSSLSSRRRDVGQNAKYISVIMLPRTHSAGHHHTQRGQTVRRLAIRSVECCAAELLAADWTPLPLTAAPPTQWRLRL